MTTNIDYAGNTLIVENVRVGATKTGDMGTEISSAEIAVLDGVTAGTVTASKAVVAGASSEIDGVGDLTITGDLVVAELTLTAAAATGTPTVAAGDAATAGASHVLTIDIDGTAYYILLTDNNSGE